MIVTTFDKNHLPVLPQTAAQLIECADNEFVTGEELAAVISHDPSVSARIVGLASSALYALREPPKSLTDAIVRVLGVDTARGVTLGIVLNNAFDLNQCKSFDSSLFWQHSLYTADINHRLAMACPEVPEQDKALGYISGLASRIGILALVTIAPEAVAPLLADDSGVKLTERLERALGTNHRALAREVATHWDLPEPICNAYNYLHLLSASNATTFSRLTKLSVDISESLLQGEDTMPDELVEIGEELSLSKSVRGIYSQALELSDKVEHLCRAVI